MVQRSTKFTGICIAIYLVYALFVFVVLPMLLPDPLAMSRTMLQEQAKHLGNLTNHTLETGGQPKRSMLVTFRGSGALSLLDYLTRQPGCYHHFSPLISYKRRVTERVRIERALGELVSLYNCDYNRSVSMLASGMRTPTFRNFHGVQWKTCVTYSPDVCWNPETMSKICRMFPFINMSVYNLGLRYLSVLLQKKDLNIRMLLLVRDPRGTMASRVNRPWCVRHSECSQPDDLCTNMVTDYTIAERLLQEFPDRFGVIRYEELAMNPLEGMKSIFEFYGLPVKESGDNLNSMGRIQKNNTLYFERPMDWMDVLVPQEVENIQHVCKEAMRLWGYRPVSLLTNVKNDTFVPIKTLPLLVK